MFNTYTVISFGNYETKILTCIFVKEKLMPIYKTSFLTNNCFQDSQIIDDDLLIKILQREFTKIPIDLASTYLIVNIPLKNLEIVTNRSNEMPIAKKDITKEDIVNLTKMTEKNFSDDKYELDKKIIYWKINGNEVENLDNLNNIETISWKINTYYTPKVVINKYLDIMKNFKCNISCITCDSLIMNHLFENSERKHKVLINIGHLKSSFDRYENGVLIDQKSIDFGIRHLTVEIGRKAGVDEAKSIEMLKIYKNLESVDEDLALINHFKEKFLDYSQIKISDIDKLINVWMNQLTSLMNMYLSEKEMDILGVDEIYFFSSMNIMDRWLKHVRNLLDKRSDILSINPKVFSLHETKYCSLVASILYYYSNQKNLKNKNTEENKQSI